MFLSSQAPRYPLGIGSMMTAFALMAASGLVYYLLCVYENKRRDRLHGVQTDAVESGLQLEKEDKTDGKNTNFRYTY